jgi:hypothetical protein
MMKKLILVAAGLMLSISVSSQILKKDKWNEEKPVSPEFLLRPRKQVVSTTSLSGTWQVFLPRFTVSQLVPKTFSIRTAKPFCANEDAVKQEPIVELRKEYVFDSEEYLEKKAIFQQKIKLIGGLTFRGSLEVLACDDELFRSPETANFSIRLH